VALSTIPTRALTEQGINFRNLIINGDMSIAQRGTSSSSLSGYTSCDRFTATNNNLDQLAGTLSQISDAPSGSGLSKSFKFTVTTPETTVDADEYFTIQHRIEGQNLQHLKFNTSSAESLTLSFWVKSAVTGTYAVGFYLVDSDRNIGSTYTINSANTWEKKTLTFVGDTSGSIGNDNTEGLRLWFILGAGSTFNNSNNTTWDTYSSGRLGYGTSNNLLTTSSATWQVTGVQLEVGTSASDFEFLPFDVNLQRCQRYYFQINPNGANGGPVYPGRTNGGADVQNVGIDCPVPLRIGNPSITIQSGTVMQTWVSTFSQTSAGGGSVTGLVDTGSNSNRLMVNTNGFSGLTGNHAAVWGPVIQSMPVDAEL